MAYVTYIAKREIEPTGFSKTGTDFTALGSDDSFDAVTTNLSGLLIDQWLQAAGFVRNAGWFQVKSNSTSAKILTNTPPVTHLRLPGVAGNYASTPDSAANSVTGDLELRVKVSLVRWLNPSANQALISKLSAAGQWSYDFYVDTAGKLALLTSPDGSASSVGTSTVVTGLTDGSAKWLRVTRTFVTGVIGFYMADDGVNWTQLGTNVSNTPGTIFNSTSELRVGVDLAANPHTAGRFYYADVRGGGIVVAVFDPTLGARGASSFVALTGETWTINTSGTPPAMLQGPLLTYEGAEYLSLPGVAGNNASTPDTAANSVTGDIDVRMKVSLASWVESGEKYLSNKGTGDRSWIFGVASGTSQLIFYASADGSNWLDGTPQHFSSIATGFAAGSANWIRVTRASASGTITYYTSPDGVVWTQLGTTIASTAGALHDSVNVLGVWQWDGLHIGSVYYAELRNGIGGPVVASFDPGRAAAGATSLTAYTGEVWTVNTSGSPAAALVRATPVTITGYKRGYGQTYSIEFKAEQVDRKVKFKRNEQRPIGGGAAEVLFQYSDAVVDVMTEIFSEASQVPQFREFLASVAAGEIFTFDRYGTIASPVDPRQAQLESVGYDEQRSMSTMQQRIPFSVRLLS